jgi:hypothetical protein
MGDRKAVEDLAGRLTLGELVFLVAGALYLGGWLVWNLIRGR